MAYIYRHIRLDTGMPFYVGASAKEDEGRYTRAFSATRKERNKDWRKVASDTDYEVEIIMDGLSVDEMFAKESEFVLMYGRLDMGTGSLVNKTDGGRGCVNGITKATREKMASKLRGRPLPDWQKAILRKAKLGKATPWSHKAIIEVDKIGAELNQFKSISHAAKEYNIPVQQINNMLKGRQKSVKGRYFKYKNKV